MDFNYEILRRAFDEGFLSDPVNYPIIAAISESSVDFVRDYASAVTGLETDNQVNGNDEPFVSGTIPPPHSTARETRRPATDHTRKRILENGDQTQHIKKKPKLTVNIEPGEYVPIEMPSKSQSPRATKTLTKRMKRKSTLLRVRFFCAHCSLFFYAKPTKRANLHVLNHQCSGDKRKQFVVGRHHRRCKYDHAQSVPCIDFAPKTKDYVD